MQLSPREHFENIVKPAIRSFDDAERRLATADREANSAASYETLREAGAAVIYLHHFVEVVARAELLNHDQDITSRNVRDYTTRARDSLKGHCRQWSEGTETDVGLLGDVAGALKHSILTQRLAERQVNDSQQVLAVSIAFGAGRYGEGRFGGVTQIVILTDNGHRLLSTVIRNVLAGWLIDFPEY